MLKNFNLYYCEYLGKIHGNTLNVTVETQRKLMLEIMKNEMEFTFPAFITRGLAGNGESETPNC